MSQGRLGEVMDFPDMVLVEKLRMMVLAGIAWRNISVGLCPLFLSRRSVTLKHKARSALGNEDIFVVWVRLRICA